MAEEKSHRLFFALWPDEPLRARMAPLAERVATHSGKPVPAANLHLTLAFLGQVDEGRMGCALRVGEGVAAPPFEMVLDCLGHFRQPQVAWLGPTNPPGALLALAARLAAGLTAACGFDAESRPFHPHVTLARKVRHGFRRRAMEPLSWRVNEFVLVESKPSTESSRYEVLGRWPLRAAGGNGG